MRRKNSAKMARMLKDRLRGLTNPSRFANFYTCFAAANNIARSGERNEYLAVRALKGEGGALK